MKPWKVFFGVWAAVAAGVAQGEDAWLQPERSAATPGATLVFGVVSADSFGAGTRPMGAERLARTIGRLGDGELKIGSLGPTERTLSLPVTLVRPGVAVVGVEMKAREVEIPAEQFESYLRDVQAGDELRAGWTALPELRRWRERSVAYAKSFVRVGEPAPGDRAWGVPLGLAWEIVPEVDPTDLREGADLPVRLLRGGKPAAGFVLTFVSTGESREHVVVTDGEGRARAKLDASGAWLVRGTTLQRANAADHEWDRESTTMVVEVR